MNAAEDEARFHAYLDRWIQGRVGSRLLEQRFFQGEVSVVGTASTGAYTVQVIRTGDDESDGMTYAVLGSYFPVVGDRVQIVWMDSKAGYCLGPVGKPGGPVHLAEVLVGTTSGYGAASPLITFPGPFPANIRHLELLITARCDTGATLAQECGLRFNGDAGSNYGYNRIDATGTVVVAQDPGAVGLTSGRNWYAPAATATAKWPMQARFMITHYAGPFNKMAQVTIDSWAVTTAFPSANSLNNDDIVLTWNNPAAITSLAIFPFAGNFVVGSLFTLNGYP